jgi:hypothetical protein
VRKQRELSAKKSAAITGSMLVAIQAGCDYGGTGAAQGRPFGEGISASSASLVSWFWAPKQLGPAAK